MKRVYVAGKLNDQAVGYIKNCHNMISMADTIQKLGFSVFVPCLDFLSGLVCGNYEYQDYADNNMAWLECADYVYVMPDSENSKGTQAEIKQAETLGIPVVYTLDFLKTISGV
jgi:Domain of unknown function (DUF4406)